MESESYYANDGDIAYIRVRSPHGLVRSEEQAWGLCDYDEQTGDLVGLEVWSASKVLTAAARARDHVMRSGPRRSVAPIVSRGER
ncbi:MAG: DUF2283 domain-containing protein [Solirubrobacteraceae bacterium]